VFEGLSESRHIGGSSLANARFCVPGQLSNWSRIAAAGQLPTVRVLIGAGEDLSIWSAHGETALSLARSNGQEECAALLTGV
jgi:hypothetical protein